MWIAHFKPSLSIHTIWLETTFLFFILHFSEFLHQLNAGRPGSFHSRSLPLFLSARRWMCRRENMRIYIFKLKRKLQMQKTKGSFFHFATGKNCKNDALTFIFWSYIYDYILIFSLSFYRAVTATFALKCESPKMVKSRRKKKLHGEKQTEHIEIGTEHRKERNNCSGTLLEMWMEIAVFFLFQA